MYHIAWNRPTRHLPDRVFQILRSNWWERGGGGVRVYLTQEVMSAHQASGTFGWCISSVPVAYGLTRSIIFYSSLDGIFTALIYVGSRNLSNLCQRVLTCKLGVPNSDIRNGIKLSVKTFTVCI